MAAIEATAKVADDPADDHLVFLLSDANLGRYGITPQAISGALQSDPSVTGHAIFVAEPSAADWLAAGALGGGRLLGSAFGSTSSWHTCLSQRPPSGGQRKACAVSWAADRVPIIRGVGTW